MTYITITVIIIVTSIIAKVITILTNTVARSFLQNFGFRAVINQKACSNPVTL